MIHVVVHLEKETIGKRRARGARAEICRSACDIEQLRHLVVELDGRFGRVLFVVGETHGDAHEEILGCLDALLVHVAHGVSIEQR